MIDTIGINIQGKPHGWCISIDMLIVMIDGQIITIWSCALCIVRDHHSEEPKDLKFPEFAKVN